MYFRCENSQKQFYPIFTFVDTCLCPRRSPICSVFHLSSKNWPCFVICSFPGNKTFRHHLTAMAATLSPSQAKAFLEHTPGRRTTRTGQTTSPWIRRLTDLHIWHQAQVRLMVREESCPDRSLQSQTSFLLYRLVSVPLKRHLNIVHIEHI